VWEKYRIFKVEPGSMYNNNLVFQSSLTDSSARKSTS